MAQVPVVLLTGASRGIGADTARWLANTGAAVSLVARSVGALDAVAESVQRRGGRALPVAADIADPEACRTAVDETVRTFGRVDALINNAGILEPLAAVAEADPDAWRYAVAVNLNGPFYLCRAALPHLRESAGRIVNVSTGAAVFPIETFGAYGASKAGLTHLTRIIAAEQPRVTTVAVRPGVVDTDMQALIRRDAPGRMPDDKARYYLRLKADGRLAAPAVPARSIAWLALWAPTDWSGEFLDYDDPRILKAAAARLGDSLA